MKATPITPTIGVELHDVDLTRKLSPDVVAELRQLFEQHHLVLVRGQDLSDDDHVRFVGHLGQVRRPNRDGTRVAYVSNSRDDGMLGVKRLLFHSDASFYDTPVWGLSLYALEVSPMSPPTIWVSAAAGYARLPADLREQLESLDAVFVQNLDEGDDGTRTKLSDIPPGADPRQFPVASHPAILREYPQLGTLLYLNELQTSHFDGIGSDESEELLQRALSVLYRPEHYYTHQWEPNDLIVWNNLALQHGRPPHPAEPVPRTLRRVVLVAP